MFLIGIGQSDENLPASEVLQLLCRIIRTSNERPRESGGAISISQFANWVTLQPRLFRAGCHQRLITHDNYFPPGGDPGHRLSVVVGKLNTDALLEGLLQPRRDFSVITLAVSLHTRTSQFLR